MARILVIDDDNDISSLIGLKLELDGHTVMTEPDGVSGLARAEAEQPDVVIIDWTLPGLTGPEVCAQLRQNPSMRATWLLMLTARPIDAGTIPGLAADEIVAKPFSPRELSARVAAALARPPDRPVGTD